MQKSEWLDIAAIVVAITIMFVAPLWSMWINSLASHPQENPDREKLKNLKRRAGAALISLFKTSWFTPLLPTSLGSYGLLRGFFMHAPVDRGFVLEMCWHSIQLTYGLVAYLILSLLKLIRLQGDMTIYLNTQVESMTEIQGLTIKAIKELGEPE